MVACFYRHSVCDSFSDFGAGIYSYLSSNPTINSCVIAGNAAVYEGGGIHLYFNSYPTIANCLIVGNSSSGGGGIYCYRSEPSITNCTIVDNFASSVGGGIYYDSVNSSPTVTNCILWGDSPQETFVLSGTPILSYCDIQGGWFGTGWNILDEDPLFVSGLLGDYALSQIASGQALDSPCVDAGSDTAVNLGLDNLTTRTDGGDDTDIVDMGYHATYKVIIDSITYDQGSVTITWIAKPGSSYTVQHSTDMENWIDVSVGVADTWTDVGVSETTKFYRASEQ